MESRKEKFLFAFIMIVYLCIFYFIYSWMWESWVPSNPPTSEVLSLVVFVLVIVPLSAVAGDWTMQRLQGTVRKNHSEKDEY
ncbi:hypothetical protein [Paenibacillus dakarensis]|uniref:hypothetical protein n=1 Tax=Paenibacillus dakarensis TaxID=1527293 RepID=UPI0006D56DDD|nr:hypothetical protein [Paenibacillus dakarensis]